MKNSPIASAAGQAVAARPRFPGAGTALLAVFLSVSLPAAVGPAQPVNYEADGEEVLTRGPVHEAFAAVVSYNPEPGIIVLPRPPELIEEIPPEERPAGDDVAWIPGYWGWDDERNDYLWISGTWRVLPPGREWMAGYWRESDGGYQWISGYWADATEQETTYLPPPPATLEVGANSEAPSDDYGWSPGSWVWQQDRYAWRAGYWAEGRADWVWVPAYYVWTPRGYIFAGGFWDYPVERRGILFAPVYYPSRGYARRDFSYSPRIAINLSLFLDNLFLRPSYHHYYFGDYYGSRYEQDGFYASISFQSSRRGFDPFYAHNRWEHRADRGWENRFRASYQDRRDHEAVRPPRTWSAQTRLNLNPTAGGSVRVQLAVPLAQLARNRDNPGRFQPVAADDRQKLAQRGREVQQSRDQRRTVEAKAVVPAGRNAAVAVAPARVAAPLSPIVAKRPQAAAPGRPQTGDRRNAPAEARPSEPARRGTADGRVTQPDERKAQPAAEPRPGASARVQGESLRMEQEAHAKARQDDEQRTREANALSQVVEKDQQAAAERARGAAAGKQPADERRNTAEAKARAESPLKTQEPQPQVRPGAERQAREANGRAQAVERSQLAAADRAKDAAAKSQLAERAQEQAEERRNAADAKVREESQRQSRQDDAEEKSRAAEKSRQQNEEQANASARKARDESQQNANEARARTQQDVERAKPPVVKAPDESPRNEPPAPARAQPNDERGGRDGTVRAKPPAQNKPAEDDDDGAKKDREKSRR